MTSTRQHKVSRLIQKELGDFFQKQGQKFTSGKMITVTVVRVSPDLGLAKVYLSLFPGDKHEEDVKAINEKAVFIRTEMGKRFRQQLKHIPEFVFYLDDSLDYIENIEGLLKD